MLGPRTWPTSRLVALRPALAADPPRVVMVLVDVSESAAPDDLRSLYLGTLRWVLEAIDGVGDPGAILAADVIDDNPLAHGWLLILARFEPCTLLENRLDCEARREDETRRALRTAEETLGTARRGTNVVGGLGLAKRFFEVYPAGERYLVVISGMLLGRGIRLARPGVPGSGCRGAPGADPGPRPLGRAGLRRGGGASRTDPPPETIEAVEAFRRAYLERAGAEVVLYGPALPRFP